jgi:hypothetical protein
MADLLLEPWQHIPTATVPPRPAAPPPLTIEQVIASAPDIAGATERIITARVLHGLASDIREGRMSQTPKLDGLLGNFSAFTARVEAAAQKMSEKMDGTATFTEAAVDKFGTAVDKVHAQAQAIDDAANQLSNGGPPLGNS